MIYSWLVFLHVLGGLGFMLVHGVSANVAFQLRRERNVERIRALLDLSVAYTGIMYGFLLVLLAAGIVAGFIGRWWGHGWIWASLALLIAISVVMYLQGSLYYSQVRKAVGQPYFENWKENPPVEPVSADELDRLLASSRPTLLTMTGVGGLAVIVWLMIFKPF